ncbi:hypothetical protein PHYC_01702 [Phycisphaerales bacterium]|nr:hypothetical protein PHYC_01702 [Phycisphaerales bacterium]
MKKTQILAGIAGAAFALAAWAQNQPTTVTNAEPTTTIENMSPNTTGNTQSYTAHSQAGRPNRTHFDFGVSVMGEWDATTKYWAEPGSQPQTSTATATFSTTPGMGGRFVTQQFKGDTGENYFIGNAWYGFNNTTQEFECAWIDNTSSNILFSHGTRDGSGAINFTGTFADPTSGQKKTTRSKMSWTSKDAMVWEMWNTNSDGSEYKSLEVTYTRTSTIPGEVPKFTPRTSTNPTNTTTSNPPKSTSTNNPNKNKQNQTGANSPK